MCRSKRLRQELVRGFADFGREVVLAGRVNNLDVPRLSPLSAEKTAASMPVSTPTVWFAAHAGSRSLAVVFVNLGHHSLKLLVGLLKEIENGCGSVAALLHEML